MSRSEGEPEDFGCPTFRELRARLFEYGCTLIYYPVSGSAPDGPREAFIINPANSQEMPFEHWGADDEPVSPNFCSHVCRRLGIDEQAIMFHASTGPVYVRSPAPPPGEEMS